MKPTLALAMLTIVVTGARVASAQPGTAGPPAPPDNPTVTTPAEPPPPPPPPTPPPAPVAVESHASRPDGFSIGIGLGWDLPTSLEQPNVTSVRFRLASGLTFEPVVQIGGTSASTDDGMGNTTTSKTGDFSLATVVRLPHRIHDRVDLVFVGAAGLGITTTDPNGPANNTTKSDIFLAWGLGLEYWIGPHWSLSLTATNPLIDAQHTSQQVPGGGPDQSSGNTAFGLIWDPNVVLMTHLYL